jgi:hypothetical protein
MIARRHVFLVIGYAPIAVETQHLWFQRSFAKFNQTWSTTGRISDLIWNADHTNARWTVETRGPNWQVETTYEPLNWDDIIHKDMSQPLLSQITGSALTFFEFVFNGTLYRYFRAHWTYGLFFLLPYFHILLFAAVAALAAYGASHIFDFGQIANVAVPLVIAFAVFVGLLYWPGRRWHLQHILVDWIFSRDFARGARPDMDARLDQFADRIMARAKAADSDEILIVGHCLGAGLVADTLTRALARDADLGRHGPKLCMLTIGATLPKFALHPRGERIRAAARRVASEPAIEWAEYHSREDAISFYKFDPVELRWTTDRTDRKPVIRRVRLKEMVDTPTWKRIRFRFLRMHLQGFLANERRTPYDYFMMTCGPIPFAKTILAPAGPMSFIAQDGSYSETVSPSPLSPSGEENEAKPRPSMQPDVVRADEMP